MRWTWIVPLLNRILQRVCFSHWTSKVFMAFRAEATYKTTSGACAVSSIDKILPLRRLSYCLEWSMYHSVSLNCWTSIIVILECVKDLLSFLWALWHDLKVSFKIDLSRLTEIINQKVWFCYGCLQMFIRRQISLNFGYDILTVRVFCFKITLLSMLLPTSCLLSTDLQLIIEENILWSLYMIYSLCPSVLEPYVIPSKFVFLDFAFTFLLLIYWVGLRHRFNLLLRPLIIVCYLLFIWGVAELIIRALWTLNYPLLSFKVFTTS